ncbi:Gfo/Idh/MocA family oxidoreductase [Actinopolymorpha singaporensis]
MPTRWRSWPPPTSTPGGWRRSPPSGRFPAGTPRLGDLLAAEQPDLMHLCTPPGAHAAAAIAALEAGATVVCEKPPCLTLAEFDASAHRHRGWPVTWRPRTCRSRI